MHFVFTTLCLTDPGDQVVIANSLTGTLVASYQGPICITEDLAIELPEYLGYIHISTGPAGQDQGFSVDITCELGEYLPYIYLIL